MNVAKAKDLFPQREINEKEIKAARLRIKEQEADIAEYDAHKGEPGYYFGRGFKGDCRKVISRERAWLKAVGAK